MKKCLIFICLIFLSFLITSIIFCNNSLSGTVTGFGFNQFGQLGNGKNDNTYIPVNTLNISNILKVSAGGEHSLALKNDGTVWAWGHNDSGQLGDGSFNDSNVPVQVKNLFNIIDICAGYKHSLAIDKYGIIWAWGNNVYGQLGNGKNTNSNIAVKVLTDKKMVLISAGDYHSLAMDEDGTVWAWGSNSCGQLGNGTTSSSNVPSMVLKLKDVLLIKAGSLFSAALKKDNTVWTWGDNLYGQLGNGTQISSKIPIQVTNLEDIQFIDAGGATAFAIDKNGNAYGWGYCIWGETSNMFSTKPVLYFNNSAISVSCGGGHFIIMDRYGDLWGMGWNEFGQLAFQDPNDFYYYFKRMNNFGKIIGYSAGSSHTLLITETEKSYSIPIVVHSPGAQGTFWKTDLFIQNPSENEMLLTFKLLKANTENSQPPSASLSISANSSITIKDVLNNDHFPEFKGYTMAGLIIDFDSEIKPYIAARIYNDKGEEGTYGQFVPSMPVLNLLKGPFGDVPSYLFGMVKNAKYRSNMGIANISSEPNEIKISMFDSEGVQVGAIHTLYLLPYNITQINNVASVLGISEDIDCFTLKIESISGKNFIVWGSIVDNITGDASFINDQVQPSDETLIMGVAHASGAVRTNWRTDLNIFNPASKELYLKLNYYRYGYEDFLSFKRLGPIPPGGSIVIEDILSKFNELLENESGFLIVTIDPSSKNDKYPIISARTYNDLLEEGTYGQFISGIDFKNSGARKDQKLIFAGITINSNFRANLGIINAESKNNNISIFLYAKDGRQISQFEQILPANKGIQINYNELKDRLGIASFEDCTIILQGTGKILGYVSMVDNKTSDPIFILPAVR
ncbi:MAG: hypothetical protein WHV67_00805 [Thermoanaerobaculia bacterium]